MMMIHNPATMAFGDHTDMQRAMDMLNEVKESIINAYVIKTGQSRAKLSHLMDAETWMDANMAIELGFADDIIKREQIDDETPAPMLFSKQAMENKLINKVSEKYKQAAVEQSKIEVETGRSVNEIMERLSSLKKFI